VLDGEGEYEGLSATLTGTGDLRSTLSMAT